VARLLRGEDLDASSASVIKAVRLAESIAALRGRPLPGLPELNEATQTVLCFGDALPLRLISEKLIISERLGKVPDETPAVPLAQDLKREQKRLRFPPEATQNISTSTCASRTTSTQPAAASIEFAGRRVGKQQRQRGLQKGTFHELWSVQWQPEFAVALIEAGVWGNTIPGAASAKVRHDANAAPDLPALTTLLDATLLSDLPEAAEHLMSRLQAVAAIASDVGHLMGALPPLANILRYGNVRKTDADMVVGVVNGLVARICIGLPGACGSLNDEAAEEMFGKIIETHAAIGLLQTPNKPPPGTTSCANSPTRRIAGLIAGRACRLLHEAQQLDATKPRAVSVSRLDCQRARATAAWWMDSCATVACSCCTMNPFGKCSTIG
jgi:hypothetical protein